MNEIVERVVKAIDYELSNDEPWPVQCERCARAAIAALREPTDGMVVTAIDLNNPSIVTIWQAMIDAALK